MAIQDVHRDRHLKMAMLMLDAMADSLSDEGYLSLSKKQALAVRYWLRLLSEEAEIEQSMRSEIQFDPAGVDTLTGSPEVPGSSNGYRKLRTAAARRKGSKFSADEVDGLLGEVQFLRASAEVAQSAFVPVPGYRVVARISHDIPSGTAYGVRMAWDEVHPDNPLTLLVADELHSGPESSGRSSPDEAYRTFDGWGLLMAEPCARCVELEARCDQLEADLLTEKGEYVARVERKNRRQAELLARFTRGPLTVTEDR